ncbi:MAG: hypothetical protein V1790_09490 [Planctomycetota bacterium]
MSKDKSRDQVAVQRAVLDYCEAFYEMRPERLERSVHPELAKFGFYREHAGADMQAIPCT